jgi:murein DD-endopeptidase MepM/ murein hydrolase activator NlpD
VDAWRAVARIVDAKVVNLCDPCAHGDRVRRVSQPPPVSTAPPVVTSPRRRPRPDIRQVVHIGLATAVVIGIAGAFVDSAPASGSSSLPTLSLPRARPLVIEPAPAPAPPIVGEYGPPVEEALFVHPLPGPQRLLPGRSSRHFGADRDGRGKALGCGRGHCGVDLGERIGMPILAVRDGVVSKVVRYDNEHGGLMVTIEHDDGLTSQYFHIKDIREDLRAGDRVEAGEPIARLGRSGIKHSPAHLHFSLLRRDGQVTERGDYLDPLPFLENAVVVPEPAMGRLATR